MVIRLTAKKQKKSIPGRKIRKSRTSRMKCKTYSLQGNVQTRGRYHARVLCLMMRFVLHFLRHYDCTLGYQVYCGSAIHLSGRMNPTLRHEPRDTETGSTNQGNGADTYFSSLLESCRKLMCTQTTENENNNTLSASTNRFLS